MPSSGAEAPLKVSTDGTAGPYIVVTPNQLNPVVDALRSAEISYQVDDEAVLLDGAPALVVIDLGHSADVARVQAILDDLELKLRHNRRPRHDVPTRNKLIIRGDIPAMQELQQRLISGPHNDWHRRIEIESRLEQTLPKHIVPFCLSKTVRDVEREVAVLLQYRKSGKWQELRLSGVIPLSAGGQLDRSQYDLVIKDFRENIIDPLTADLNVRVVDRDVSDQPPLEAILSPEANARARAFSDTANKTSPHELDLRRWASFVGQTHLDDTTVDPVILDNWLIDEGFASQVRKFLIQEFESGRRLLNEFDNEQQS